MTLYFISPHSSTSLLSLTPSPYHYPRARNTVYSLCGWSDISWSSALTGEILRLLGLRLTTRDGTTRRWRCSVARVKAGCGQQVQISERPQQWPTHLVARSTMRALTVPHSSTPHEALSRAPGCAARACANHAPLDAPLDGGRPDRSIVGGGRKMAALGIDWSSSRLETLVRLARAQSVSGSIPYHTRRGKCVIKFSRAIFKSVSSTLTINWIHVLLWKWVSCKSSCSGRNYQTED